jgi:hypothetical protein
VLRPIDVIWSKSPEIVTLGTGAWAKAGRTCAVKLTRASTAGTMNLRSTALLLGWNRRVIANSQGTS